MSFLQAFNYTFAPFAASPFGPSAATGRFPSYTSPGNQLLSQTPQEIASSFPLPPSISSTGDYYGNPRISDHQQQQVVEPQQQQQQINRQIQPQQQQFHQQIQSPQQAQIYSSHNTPPGAPELITQHQQPHYQHISHLQQQQQQQQQQQLVQHQPQQHELQQQPQELEQAPQVVQQSQPHPQQQQQRKRRPKNSRVRSVGLGNTNDIRVTPIQGPIYAKDGLFPVVPLYSYNSVNNGTLYQIPILWTALSYALGLEIRGEILRGLPCIKRLNQLFCPTAGTTYPLDRIERFIDENKALIKRMYGEFTMNPESYIGPIGGNTLRRSAREVYEDDVPNLFAHPDVQKHNLNKRDTSGNSTDSHVRTSRQTVNPRNGGPTQQPKSNKVDSCESTVEIVTPYWAANSSGKVRAIVNTQHFEQAIHQEVCAKTTTKRCSGDCACEQKYKWHRLLAYEPDNDCRGIFMDWFLFPSCCVCRCNPISS